MTTKISNVTGYVKPLGSGTRTRVIPSTYSTVVKQNLSPANIIEIDKTLLYLENDPNLAHVRKDDLWGHVIKVDGVPPTKEEWVAIDYHHNNFTPYPICSKHYSPVSGNPDPNPDPTPVFPESFVLIDPSGARAEYVFVRIIEE